MPLLNRSSSMNLGGPSVYTIDGGLGASRRGKHCKCGKVKGTNKCRKPTKRGTCRRRPRR